MARMMAHSLFLAIIGEIIFSYASGELVGLKTDSQIMSEPLDPDVGLDTPLMIKRHEFNAESHYVCTEDNYLLTLHRIPREGAPVVLLQHGLLGSSADWVMAEPEKGLAYILASKGYDVWLGNFRGNTYSRAHKIYPTTNPKYWNFSWHEMGVYDLPAMISYIVNKTNQKVIYIGHSMGTTAFYVMCSERHEMTKHVVSMFSLAPEAFVGRMKSPIRLLAPFSNQIEWVLEKVGADEFLPQSDFIKLVATYGCNVELVGQEACANVLFAISGYDSPQCNRTLLPVILSHTPAGASTKAFVHYGQEIVSAQFRQFDYGVAKNRVVYNSTKPPNYNLSKITVPTYLYYGQNDWLCNIKDVRKLARKLPNLQAVIEVPFKKFNHLDFLWAIDVKKLVYDDILRRIGKHHTTTKGKRTQNGK